MNFWMLIILRKIGSWQQNVAVMSSLFFGPQLPPVSSGCPPGKCPSLGGWRCSEPHLTQGRAVSG